MKRLILPLILVFVLQSVIAQKEMQINASELNVRSSPNEDSEILGVLKRSDIVKTYESSEGWTEIDYQGNRRCYVSSDYLVEVQAENNIVPIESKDGETGKGNFWASLIIVSGISLFVLYRTYTFLVAIFGNSSNGKTNVKSASSQISKNEVRINELKNFDSYGRFQVFDEFGKCISHGSLSSHENLIGYTEQFYITIDHKPDIRTYDPYCKLLGTLRLGSHEKFHNCVGGNFSTNIIKKRRIYDKHARQISERAI